MDGNRRWAEEEKGYFDKDTHFGLDALWGAVECCLQRGIPNLTVFTLSIENLSRTDSTLRRIYTTLNFKGVELASKLSDCNVRMRFVGDRSLFDPSVKDVIEYIEATTEGNTALHVSALFCYGGQQEIAAAAKAVACKVEAGDLCAADVTPAVLEREMWTAGMPPPDLIIRTGGSKRLSNFFLYQAAYTEFVFWDVLWPRVTLHMLLEAVDSFGSIHRNFGC
jgi:undecaprenyl diphosphate synthase